jgi:uncharacterized membrane protein YbhN (UPF0104 family)/tRNA A-37 threonylcarbamoyl transferase component Bud32
MVRASTMRQDVDVESASVTSAAARPWWPMPRRDARGRERVRRPGDGVALFFAIVVFVILVVRANDVSVIGANVFTLVHGLPEGLHGIFTFVYYLGSLWMVAVVAVAALIRRNVLLAVTVTISGLVAAAAAHLFVAWFDTEHNIDLPRELVAAGATSSFPLVRMAIVTALAVAATPYVMRPIRVWAWTAAGAVGLAAVYLAEGLPGDVLGGAVLGFGVACAVFLAIGAPAGRPTVAQVRDALTLLRIDTVDVVESDASVTGAVEMLATTADGRHLVARVLGRDQRDASFLAKTWRWLMQKDFQPNLFVTRVNEVEHEAYVTLMAQRAGVGVPDVVVAGAAGPDAAMLVEAYPSGRPLHHLEAAEITPALIAELWQTMARLRAAGIAHGQPSADRFIVAADASLCLTDFSSASAGARPESLHRDVAELLAATAVLVGAEAATAAAIASVGPDAVREALPFVQPVVISRSTRRGIGRHSKLLEEVRTAGATALGEKPPELEPLRRVTMSGLLMAVFTFIAIYVMLGQIGELSGIGDALASAEWGWVILGFVFSLFTYPAAAIALLAALPNRIPMAPVTELQLATKFTNLVTPAEVGSAAMNIRFLQGQGVDAATAVTSGVAISFLSTVAQVLLFTVCLLATGGEWSTQGVPEGIGRIILIAIIVLGVLAAIAARVPKLRRMVAPQIRKVWNTITRLAKSPGRTLTIIGSGLLGGVLYALCLGCCLRAYGDHLSLATLIVVNSSASTVANLAPVPGGMGVAEAGLVAGLTAAGVDSSTAVAAVLTHRLITFWLPPMFGWLAIRDLSHRKYI